MRTCRCRKLVHAYGHEAKIPYVRAYAKLHLPSVRQIEPYSPSWWVLSVNSLNKKRMMVDGSGFPGTAATQSYESGPALVRYDVGYDPNAVIMACCSPR